MAQLDLDVLPSAETRESADEFINRLSDNGLSSMNAEMREMIKSELEANYDELYARPGHFLYELLQNADDVNYEDPDPEPALCITTENPFDSVRFDCNETGFTRRNVRAICRSRMSTKMGEVGTTGEKGIGFKSVFAVSKTASIASGPYRFRLDKSQEFGVICPTVWDADVPDDLAVERQKGSVLVLEIDQNEKAREEVRSMIRGFRPDTMLFLRQLKRLEISTYPPLSPVIFRRQEILDEDGTTHLTIQQDERCRSCFKVFEKSVYGLKPRRRYPKVKESKIKLAFPVDPKFEHAVASSLMQVYTFLPVSEYGLGFTLQAEFVLTSSREDIQPLVDWNDGLLEAIPGIFCEAIHLLNPTCLRFSWPIFLSLSEPKGFFKDVRKKIIAKLNQERVLQVEDKTKPLSVPSAVTIVPDKYKLKGLPLVRSEAALSRYLSHKYLESCIPYLRYAMGIKELDTDSFIRDLQDYVNDESSSSTVLDGEDKDVPFRAQSLEWHSRVASILKKHTWHSRVKAMNMIPLNDGETWVAATSEDKASIFFQPQESQQHDLLDGINIRFVHPDIMSEENMQRYQLFEALGVEKYDSTKLCKLVEAAHKDRLIPEIGENPSPNTLISHALFLFRNSHTPSVDLWVATEAGKQSRASATYFESIGRPVQGWECPVLHPDYYTCVKDEHELRRWRSWLDNELGVRKYLRLVNVFPRLAASPIHNKFNISQEMECILADTVNWRPYDILTLLYSHWDNEHCTDEHWAHYHSFFKYDIRWDYDSVFTLRRRISELQVYCLGPDGGVLRNLEGTILPSDSLGGNYENAPIFILDVKGDKSERVQGIRWHFLEIFGVKLDLDLDDCIACLKKLRDKVDPGKRQAFVHVPFLYDRLTRICQDCPDRHERIRDLFNSEALIYIPQYSKSYRIPWPINATWVTARNCVWKGAKYAKLKNRNVISHHYGRHETLFLHVARVQATIEISDVLSEIEFNAIAYSSEDLYGILRELNEFIKDIKEDSDPSRQKSRRSDSDLCKVLSRHRIFPVSQPGSTAIVNLTCAPSSQWFIPDHQSFRDLFIDTIPLLNFDSVALGNISYLLQYLGCNRRRLSSRAKACPTNPDQVRLAKNYSEKLRKKAKYIQALVPDSLPYSRPSLIATEIAVYRADSDTVTVDWLVESDGSTHKSSTYESSVVVMFHGRTLKIYMPAKFTEQHALPPLDLAYDLGALLGIPAENSALVEQILTRVWEQDTTEIEKVLTRRKLKFDFPNEGQIQDHFEEEPSEEPSEEEPPEEHRSITETQQNDQANSAKMHVERIAIRPKKEDSGPIKDVKSEVQDEDIGSVTIADEKKDDRGQKEEFFESEETDNVKEDEAERIAINSLQGDLSITSGMSDGPQMTLSNSENWSNDLVKSSEDSNEDDEDPLKLFQMVHKSLDVSLVQGSTSLSVKQKSIPDVEEGHFRIETSTPLISKEELLYFRPRISSPTPSDDGEPDESDYSTDDVDSPLPGAQPASRSQDVKPADSKLPSPTAKNEHQAQKQAPAKLTITSSKSARSPLSKEMSLLQMRQFVSPLRNATPNERVDRQYNVRRFQRTGLFRPSGPTNIVYVNDFNDMPVESKSNDPQILATLQARMQVFKDNRTRTVFALIPTIVNEEDTELAFLGQAWVSQMLFNCLGSACYKPQRDWRSSMRTGLGYDEVDTSIGSETPFIIERNTDALSQFLFQQGYEPAGRWMRNSPGVRIYYIDVQTTPDSRPSPFTVTPDRMEKMRECHISRESEAPEKVYILVRLSDVHPRHPSVIPTAWFFINPWAYYTEGLMRAHFSNANETFSMKISRNAPPSFTMKSPECDLDDSTSSPDIVDRVARLFSSSKSRDQTRRPQDLRVAPSQTPYRYKSLRRADRIRLLALSPGKGATPLRGDLKVHRLQENSSPPEYACVSYVWGSSLRQFTLYTPEGMLMLTASLYLALLHLRDATKVVYIWADAICIDQEDSPGRRNEEKEHQIRMLPRIFQRAKTVFAWLGIEENGSRKVMRKFEDWGTKILQERHGELNDKAEITDPIWVYVSRLFSRRWFARIWIVQEVALANELVVVCGKHRLSWDIFYAAAQHCLIRNKYDPKIDIATLDTAKNIIDLGQLRKDFTPEPVFKLLNRCYQKEATVPRDRIFALLSMATDKDEAGFGPNYLLDNVTIIQRLSSTFVKQGYAIDLLYRTRPETRTIEEHRIKGEEWVRLPSWMPDLTANHYPSSLSTWSRNYAAGVRKSEEGKLGSRKEPKHLARVQGRELLLRGYVACKIGKQGNCHSMVDDVFSYLEEMFDTIDRLYDRKKTAQEIEEIKWKTAIGDATNLLSEEGDQKSGSAGDEVPSTEHTPEKAKKIQQHMQQRRKRFEAQAAAAYGALVGYLALERPHSSWKRQKLRFEYAMKKGQQQAFPGPAAEDRDAWRRLMPYVDKAMAFAEAFTPQRVVVCNTDKGDVGVVPAVASEGDVVALFPGATVPFLLRKNHADEYELLGECYVHGIMRGEAFPASDEEEQVFRLV